MWQKYLVAAKALITLASPTTSISSMIQWKLNTWRTEWTLTMSRPAG